MKQPDAGFRIYLVTALLCTTSALSLVLYLAGIASAEPTLLVWPDDAYILHNPDAGTWSIGNSSIAYTVGFGSDGALRAISLEAPGFNRDWDLEVAADGSFQVAGRDVPIGSSSSGMVFRGFSTEEANGGEARFLPSFELPERQLHVTRVCDLSRRSGCRDLDGLRG